jgi:hypothetical protein
MRTCFLGVLASLILAPMVFSFGCSAPIQEDLGTAAIVDQLHSIQPNPSFINRTTAALEVCGFEVDVYQGDEVTVDFYRKLPSRGYKLILFRVHAGLLTKEGEIQQGTWLFTDEPHSRTKYVNERLAGSIVKARTAENKPWLFAVGSEFVTNSMEGRFDNTVIIMMGCYCLYLDDLAQAFTQKGASVYLGWDGNVTLPYIDEATINLMGNLFRKDTSIKQAVEKTMAEVGFDPDWDACLTYYPAESSNKTIMELKK